MWLLKWGTYIYFGVGQNEVLPASHDIVRTRAPQFYKPLMHQPCLCTCPYPTIVLSHLYGNPTSMKKFKYWKNYDNVIYLMILMIYDIFRAFDRLSIVILIIFNISSVLEYSDIAPACYSSVEIGRDGKRSSTTKFSNQNVAWVLNLVLNLVPI